MSRVSPSSAIPLSSPSCDLIGNAALDESNAKFGGLFQMVRDSGMKADSCIRKRGLTHGCAKMENRMDAFVGLLACSTVYSVIVIMDAPSSLVSSRGIIEMWPIFSPLLFPRRRISGTQNRKTLALANSEEEKRSKGRIENQESKMKDGKSP